MKRLCFIIPYFGKLPNYFPLFLKSCGTNKDFNWILFTDDMDNYDYPPNVERIQMSFKECQELVQSRFDFPVVLTKPYKLCDLKPMYGYIFEDYIKDYRFWGHCDVDTIMGNLGKWLTEDCLEKHDKLFCLGHMTIYRNTPENNRVFMSNINGYEIYKKILSTSTYCNFDEEWNNDYNINEIFKKQCKRIFETDYSLNIAPPYNRFHRIQYIGKGIENTINGYLIEKYKDALYLWDKGDIYRLYKKNNQLIREDFLYMHFQWRKMKMDHSTIKANAYKIVPDEFLPLEVSEISEMNFNLIKKNGFCWHRERLLLDRIKKKIKHFLN